MINSSEIKEKAERLYPAFLAATIRGEPFFPKDFSVGKLPDDYLVLRDAVNQLIEKSKQNLSYGYTVELTPRKTRKHGSQSLPTRISIDTEVGYLKLLNKEKEFTKFKANLELIRLGVPELKSWLTQNPLRVVEYAGEWIDLLKVCQYFQINPNPNLYIRELPIKVHTKFIEDHEGILRGLLEAILPTEALHPIEFEKDRVFEKRFSLRYSEPLVRLRILDNALKTKYSFPVSDLSTPLSEFRQLNLEKHRFIITENRMNLLTLPALADSFALYVGGYAVLALKPVTWLAHCPIFYWGDLDVDGFKILSQLRSYFPHTISVMMDEKTFTTFEGFAVTVAESNTENLPYLTPEEHCLFSYLSKQKRRLEQERISQDFANRYLQKVLQQDAQQRYQTID